ncbi:MAG TPA: site-specific integrase [Desulfosporosinus sp.]|nr:site-specific integrase [Desulfosporosinus sp.]
MKPTDFAYYLTDYLSKYLPNIAGLSMNTIMSYRDTFSLLLAFCNTKKKLPPEKITLTHINKELIEEYLGWLETDRRCAVSTRNVRLAAIHAFYKYLQIEYPDYIYQAQQILAIPVKRTKKNTIEYLSLDAMQLLLRMPDEATKEGRRDRVLLSLLYDSAARVQELADVKVSDVRIQSPSTVKLTGKGNKSRIVPLMKPMAILLEQYLMENQLISSQTGSYPLFCNRSKDKLTRAGMAYIVTKHFDLAKQRSPQLFPDKISPHGFRHSKSMHLLQSGVNLVYIRDFLGHVDIQTTELYAKIDGEMKRKALEKSNNMVVSEKLPEWQSNAGLMNWLKNLGK